MKRTGLMFAVLGLFLFAQAAQADWTPAKRLTWTSGSSGGPAIAIDSSKHIHIVWQDDTPGKDEIYYKRSEDGGTTWSAAKRLTWTSGWSLHPAIAADSGNALHVVWEDDTSGSYDIYYKKSADGGTSWSTAKRLFWTSGGSYYPALDIDSGGVIHVVWDDNTVGNEEIYYKRSSDGGATWSAVKRLTWTAGTSQNIAIDIDSGGAIHVVWEDCTPGHFEIYYKRSSDGGATWSTAKRLTWTSGWSWGPAIAIDSSDAICAVWDWDNNTLGYAEIYYRRSPDAGTTWTPAKRLTWTGKSWYPTIAIDLSSNIHVVWEDDTLAYGEIYYVRSPDGGMSWNATQRLTWTAGNSLNPAIAIDSGGDIHVVWEDSTPYNFEIYYKKGT
jgi:BNR repeat-containing family member